MRDQSFERLSDETGFCSVDIWKFLPAPGRRPAGVDAAAGMLSAAEADRAARIPDSARRHRYMTSHCGARVVLAEYLETTPTEVGMCAEENGAPRVVDDHSRDLLSISLSHSRDVTVLAIAGPGRQIGVDIEVADETLSEDAVARIALASPERDWLQTRPRGQRLGFLLRSWTLKESLMKAARTGLTTPPQEIVIAWDSQEPEIVQRPDFLRESRLICGLFEQAATAKEPALYGALAEIIRTDREIDPVPAPDPRSHGSGLLPQVRAAMQSLDLDVVFQRWAVAGTNDAEG